ncbi:uncharacterized protein KQ657_003831 [Scheffersomyces spartinae]|uniref:Uncharacterized protein n=1 Tax=Scheffersomyces spartinae TaxID=45513 RepID=A0A9P7VCI9_9ASCO|nr:uncharacterized protein KQ657_003831 [Scheffersomyces spartinae]KAG7195303.1 hypothetical protein KQ657_003831 [Scheffersomyces spartinae]
MNEPYTAVKGLYNLVGVLHNDPDEGTGILKLVKFVRNLQGHKIPEVVVKYSLARQINLFGGYPSKSDIWPSAVLAAIFGILALAHLFVFLFNWSRGHYFYLTLIFGFCSLMKLIGFTTRAIWGGDQTLVQVGLTSEFFIIAPFVIVVSANLVLAQRIFAWRHPVGGNRWLFWNFMIFLYIMVAVLLGITVLASFVPYINLISTKSYHQWNQVVMATAIIVDAYSLTAISLIALAFFFKPTRKDENLYTYQPWWIESFSPFYYVKKNAAQEAEETFMKRNHNHRHAIRVIAATHHNYNTVEGLTNQRGSLKHNTSIVLITITTLLILIPAIGRTVVVFHPQANIHASPAANKTFMYISWGIFDIIIHILYLVGRVDLRFYRPDILPQKVRSIITAEQSYYPSDNEDYVPRHTKEYQYSESYDGFESIVSPPRFSFEDEKAEKKHAHFNFPSKDFNDERDSEFHF